MDPLSMLVKCAPGRFICTDQLECLSTYLTTWSTSTCLMSNNDDNSLPIRPAITSKWLQIITVTSSWARWHLKSPASRLLTQPFIRAQIKGNIKVPRHWPLCVEFTGDRDKGPVTRKMFPFDDVIISEHWQKKQRVCEILCKRYAK